jgi:hypothetical protein
MPPMRFVDDFDGPGLDTDVWVPHYLPQWSSRAESAATYALAGSELRLTIPPEQGLWCPGDHDPLKVDPALTEEWDAPRVAIDVSEHHLYATDWQPGRIDFTIDGEHVKTVDQAPDYPMQMMVAVFDFPDKPGPSGHTPQLAVDFIRGG